jgi:hypothetical protein
MKLAPQRVTNWQIAGKTRPIKAKPLISLLVDRSVVSKFLVDTLEGKEPLGDGVVICVGEAGDTWQQMPKKLLAKYDVVAIDNDGWMICNPKPDNAVQCVEITQEVLRSPSVDAPPTNEIYKICDFYVIGQWGQTVPEIGQNVQLGHVGDFVCQNRTDATDVWIVKRKLFLNTYVIKS